MGRIIWIKSDKCTCCARDGPEWSNRLDWAKIDPSKRATQAMADREASAHGRIMGFWRQLDQI